jgi:hypothetical protein
MPQPLGFTTLQEALDTQSIEGSVWHAVLDGRYVGQVQRVSRNSATLCLFDSAESMKCLFEQQVSLAYGAIMGPDIDDVIDWQQKLLDFIDARP